MSNHQPPSGAKSIAEILEAARSQLNRVSPAQLLEQLKTSENDDSPIHLIDIRPVSQRAAEGSLTIPPDASPQHKVHVIERNVLEWRLDPQSPARIKELVDPAGYSTRVIVFCSESYTSSLAARELQRLGLRNATDLEGGYMSWKALRDHQQD